MNIARVWNMIRRDYMDVEIIDTIAFKDISGDFPIPTVRHVALMENGQLVLLQESLFETDFFVSAYTPRKYLK